MKNFFEVIGFVVASVGGAGVIIIGFSSWIGKIWANKLYENERRKQETYLKEIQNEFDIKLAEINSQLEKSKSQFELLNKERVEVIKNLYAKLVDMEDYLRIYFRGLTTGDIDITTKTMEYVNVENSVADFMDYNNHNRIFFEENVCHEIKEMDALITIILNIHLKLVESPTEEEELEKQILELVNKLIKEEIPKIKQNLEDEFRRIIGVIG